MIDKELFINSTYDNPNDVGIFFFILFIIFLIYKVEMKIIQYLLLILVVYFFMNSRDSILYSNIIFFLINWNHFCYINWTKYYMLFTIIISSLLIMIDKLYDNNDIFFISQTVINLLFFCTNLYIICFYKEGIRQGREIIISTLMSDILNNPENLSEENKRTSEKKNKSSKNERINMFGSTDSIVYYRNKPVSTVEELANQELSNENKEVNGSPFNILNPLDILPPRNKIHEKRFSSNSMN